MAETPGSEPHTRDESASSLARQLDAARLELIREQIRDLRSAWWKRYLAIALGSLLTLLGGLLKNSYSQSESLNRPAVEQPLNSRPNRDEPPLRQPEYGSDPPPTEDQDRPRVQ